MATPTKFGSEFLVNTITLNAQDEPVVKALANGTFIVAWTDASGLGGDSFDRGIEAQLFNADGSKLGSQFLVNAVTTADQSGPDIGAFSDGSFVISWLHDPDPADDQGFARARIFNADGTSNTPQVQFIPSAGQPERAPRLAVLNDGTVVGTVSTAGTLAGDGIAVQNEGNFSAVFFNPPGNQIEPRIAALSDGGYVVVWWNSDGADTSLSGQKFNADGTTSGSLFAIETTTPGLQGEPEVSALPGGGFVVVWVDDPGPEASDFVVRARVFPAAGPADPDFVISGAPAGFITAPAVTTLADGRLLAAWQVGGIIRAQVFTSDGALDGSQFVVNSTLTGFQLLSTVSLTTLSDGRVVVVWSDVSESGGDISDVAVRGQILDPGGTVTAAPTITPPDFNGDGNSDVLWRHASGFVAEWQMNGANIAANLGVATPGNEWHFQDTGDLNGDGKSDVLWRHDNGQVVLWQMDGATILSNQSVATIGNDWHNEGVADFGGDGRADVLWHNDNGQVALWTMDGAQITNNQLVATLGAGWHFQGLLDTGGDGKSDVLLRNDSGQVVLWTMDGAQITANQSVANLGLDWNIVGTGDFGGDGKGDVLLRNDSGQVVIWTMDGNQIVDNQSVGTPGNDWHVQDVGDYNGDGRSDVLWRNDSGQVVVWAMNGAQIVSNHTVTYQGGTPAPIGLDWTVLSHHYDLL